MNFTIKELFSEEEWEYIKANITTAVESIADFPLTIDCEEVE